MDYIFLNHPLDSQTKSLLAIHKDWNEKDIVKKYVEFLEKENFVLFCEPLEVFSVSFKTNHVELDNKNLEIKLPELYITAGYKLMPLSVNILEANSLNTKSNQNFKRSSLEKTILDVRISPSVPPERPPMTFLISNTYPSENLAESIKQHIGCNGHFVDYNGEMIDYNQPDLQPVEDPYQYVNYRFLVMASAFKNCEKMHAGSHATFRKLNEPYVYNKEDVTNRSLKFLKSLQNKIETKRDLCKQLDVVKNKLKESYTEHVKKQNIKHPLMSFIELPFNLDESIQKDRIIQKYINFIGLSKIIVASNNPERFFTTNNDEIELEENIKLIIVDLYIVNKQDYEHDIIYKYSKTNSHPCPHPSDKYLILCDQTEISNEIFAEFLQRTIGYNGVLRDSFGNSFYGENIRGHCFDQAPKGTRIFYSIFLFVEQENLKPDYLYVCDKNRPIQDIDKDLLYKNLIIQKLEDFCDRVKQNIGTS